MKTITKSGIALLSLVLFACGGGREEKVAVIESAAQLRAASFCSADTAGMGGPAATYQYYLDALSIGLKDQGVEGEDLNKAIDLFDQKIRASCPGKYPK